VAAQQTAWYDELRAGQMVSASGCERQKSVTSDANGLEGARTVDLTAHILATPPGSSVDDATYMAYCYVWQLSCQDESWPIGSQSSRLFCDLYHKSFSSFWFHG